MLRNVNNKQYITKKLVHTKFTKYVHGDHESTMLIHLICTQGSPVTGLDVMPRRAGLGISVIAPSWGLYSVPGSNRYSVYHSRSRLAFVGCTFEVCPHGLGSA